MLVAYQAPCDVLWYGLWNQSPDKGHSGLKRFLLCLLTDFVVNLHPNCWLTTNCFIAFRYKFFIDHWWQLISWPLKQKGQTKAAEIFIGYLWCLLTNFVKIQHPGSLWGTVNDLLHGLWNQRPNKGHSSLQRCFRCYLTDFGLHLHERFLLTNFV